MAQYRDFTTTFRITDDDIILTSQMGVNQQTDTVVRDGSVETNFKTAVYNHLLTILSLAPSNTSPPCTVATVGRWRRSFADGTVTGTATIIYVPAGNSGDLELHRDTGSFTVQYKVNTGSWTTFTDGTVITVTNGDTLAFQATSIPESEIADGFVLDFDTGVQLDVIALYNTTPEP